MALKNHGLNTPTPISNVTPQARADGRIMELKKDLLQSKMGRTGLKANKYTDSAARRSSRTEQIMDFPLGEKGDGKAMI